MNLYGFAGGDPVNFADPFGLCPDPKDPHCTDLPLVEISTTRNIIKASAAIASGGTFGRVMAGVIDGALGPATETGPPANTITGRRGFEVQVPRGTNSPAEIDGINYTGHSLDQMQGRGITPSMVKETLQSGGRSAGNDGATVIRTKDMRVITNPNGSIKTVMWQ